jgi:excisionase family DNA binding protein
VSAAIRLAFTKAEAAASIGCSIDFFEEHIQPHLRLVRVGRKVLVPIKELERWLEKNAALTLDSS